MNNIATLPDATAVHRIGLISDTHGLVRPEALAFLQGSHWIVHAGDIVDPAILARLAEIAPVTAVRGNNDVGAWAAALREVEDLQCGGVRLRVLHDRADLRTDPAAEGVRIVVTGHSHRPLAEERGGVLYINPGSAGPRRFKLPVSVGELTVQGGHVAWRLVTLTVA